MDYWRPHELTGRGGHPHPHPSAVCVNVNEIAPPHLRRTPHARTNPDVRHYHRRGRRRRPDRPAQRAASPANIGVGSSDTPPSQRPLTKRHRRRRLVGCGFLPTPLFRVRGLRGRGLHSFTSQLNLSAFCGIGVARRDCGDRVEGVFRVFRVCKVFLCVRPGSS